MPIQIIDNFDLRVSKAIDNRFVVGAGQFYTNKDNIDYKYPGLRVWDLDLSIPFVWTGATWSNETTSSVTGSGTIGTIPKFTGAPNNIGDSVIKEASTNIGIGGAPSSNKLKVYGNVESTATFIGTAWNSGTGLTNINLGTNGSNVIGTIGLSNLQNASAQGRILISGVSTPDWTDQIQIGTAPASGSPGNGLYFKNDITSRLYALTGTGLIFNIGSSEPLHLTDGQMRILSGSLTTPGLAFQASTNTGIYHSYDGITFTRKIHFGVNGSEIMRVQRTTLGSLNQVIMEGRLYIQDGSSTSPGISFESDTNTGIYSVTADTLGISTGGSKRMEIANTGIKIVNQGSLTSLGSFPVPNTGGGAGPTTNTITITSATYDRVIYLQSGNAFGGSFTADPLGYMEVEIQIASDTIYFDIAKYEATMTASELQMMTAKFAHCFILPASKSATIQFRRYLNFRWSGSMTQPTYHVKSIGLGLT